MTAIGLELGDILLFLECPIFVIAAEGGATYYVGLYNTHNSYYVEYSGINGRQRII